MDSLHAKVTLTLNDLTATLTLTIDQQSRLKEVVLPRWQDEVKEFVPFTLTNGPLLRDDV